LGRIGDDNEGSAHAGAEMPQQDGVVVVPDRYRCRFVGPEPVISNSTFENNHHGIVNNSPSSITVDARNNYWGANSGPYHETLNISGTGDPVSDGVLFEPWTIGEDLVSVCERQLDVMLILDSSYSIEESKNELADLKNFAIEIVNAFTIDEAAAQVGIIQFGDNENINILQSLSGDAVNIIQTIRTIENVNGTDIGPAIRAARDELIAHDRNGVPQVMILLSDGDNQSGTTDPVAESAVAEQHGITILTVSVGDETDIDLLKAIASDPDRFFFEVRALPKNIAHAEPILKTRNSVLHYRNYHIH
jgi:uncharacterized protein YegL